MSMKGIYTDEPGARSRAFRCLEAHANFPYSSGEGQSPVENRGPAQLRRCTPFSSPRAAGSPWNHLLPALSHRPTEGSVSKNK